jgi:hypothetical protein
VAVQYLFSSYKASRMNNVSNEFLFFMQLKDAFPQGYVNGKDYLNQVQSKIQYSKGQISNLFKELISIGWVEIWGDENHKWRYVIRSMKFVYNKLGFRFKKQNNHYRFKRIETLNKSKQQIKAAIQSCEILKNKKSQLFFEQKRLQAKLIYHLSKEQDKKREARVSSIKNELKEIDTTLQTIDGSQTSDFQLIRSKISLKKIASLLGNRSASVALKLNKTAEIDNLYSVNRSKILVADKIPFLDYLFGIKGQVKNTFWKFGKVYQMLCNSYCFNLQNPGISLS